MDLNFLDTSSKVTPILVRLYDSHKLYGLAEDKDSEARDELGVAVSELLELELSPKESELVADVLIALMRQAEKDLRLALSEKLSVVENTPLRLILQFANDDIDVASPVLRNSVVLGDMDLMYIIKSQSASYWQEIAHRQMMSDQVMEALAETEDLQTAMNLVENKGIFLTENALNTLSVIAQGEEDLAAPLLRRDEVTSEIANQLYHYVGESLKQFVADHYGTDNDHIADAVDGVVSELQTIEGGKCYMPSSIALNAADRFKEKDLLTVRLMVGTLKRGQVSSFIAQLSRFINLDPEVVYDMLMQENGQALAVVARAYSITKPDFVSIFLMTNVMRSSYQEVSIADMNKALRYFDRMEESVAKEIMENSLQDALKSQD